MEDPMTDLSHEARLLLRQGRSLGEPSDADVARVRSSLMRRVGVATTVVATGSAVSKAATAARVAFLGSSMATKVVAVTALVSAGVAGGVAYRAGDSKPVEVQATPAVPRPETAARAAVARGPVAAPSATQTDVVAERAVPTPIDSQGESAGVLPARRPIAPEKREAPARPAAAPLARPAETAPDPAHAEKPVAAGTQLGEDVAALREAQAALLAGHPQQALDVGARVRADGPLGEEREGLLLVARCALGAPGVLDQARDFAQRHEGSPLVLRVQRACSNDLQTKRVGAGHSY
jgi:hypothetical protein